MENYISAYVSTHRIRTFKSKGLKYNDLITQGFNFSYAGICSVFITYTRKKYCVCCTGFTYDGTNIFFSKNRTKRVELDNLYQAILAFHNVVQAITSSLDWFTPDFFESLEFYNYANEEIFR